jgi:hypothetical protein
MVVLVEVVPSRSQRSEVRDQKSNLFTRLLLTKIEKLHYPSLREEMELCQRTGQLSIVSVMGRGTTVTDNLYPRAPALSTIHRAIRQRAFCPLSVVRGPLRKNPKQGHGDIPAGSQRYASLGFGVIWSLRFAVIGCKRWKPKVRGQRTDDSKSIGNSRIRKLEN